MRKVLEAIYRNGVLVPLEPLDLPEGRHLTIAVRLPALEEPAEALEAWHRVYAGLSEEEVAEAVPSSDTDRVHRSPPAHPLKIEPR